MTEDLPPDHSRPTGEATAEGAEAIELRVLRDELPLAAAEAVVALRFAIATPTREAISRFRECAARVNRLTDRINAILGKTRGDAA